MATMPDSPRADHLALRSDPAFWLGVKRGFGRRCPACGVGRLFTGYLSVAETCEACGNDNEQYPSDDFAPYLTIFLVLHLLTPIFILADRYWHYPLGLEAAITIPVFLVCTLAVLPFAKGAVIGFAWAYGVTRGG
jgi:uncharacterized protein (DUF983 family)